MLKDNNYILKTPNKKNLPAVTQPQNMISKAADILNLFDSRHDLFFEARINQFYYRPKEDNKSNDDPSINGETNYNILGDILTY